MFNVDGNLIEKENGELIARAERGSLFDETGEEILTMDGNSIKNLLGTTLATVEGGALKSASGYEFCTIGDARLKFNNSNNLDDITVAALWLCFVKGIR